MLWSFGKPIEKPRTTFAREGNPSSDRDAPSEMCESFRAPSSTAQFRVDFSLVENPARDGFFLSPRSVFRLRSQTRSIAWTASVPELRPDLSSHERFPGPFSAGLVQFLLRVHPLLLLLRLRLLLIQASSTTTRSFLPALIRSLSPIPPTDSTWSACLIRPVLVPILNMLLDLGSLYTGAEAVLTLKTPHLLDEGIGEASRSSDECGQLHNMTVQCLCVAARLAALDDEVPHIDVVQGRCNAHEEHHADDGQRRRQRNVQQQDDTWERRERDRDRER